MKTPALFTIITSVIMSNSFSHTGEPDKSSSEKIQLSISIVDFQHPTCQGGSDGYIQITVSGGTAPYEYNWNTFPNQYQDRATELTAGVYFIHVTDAEGNKYYRSVELRDGSELSELQISETDYTPESALKVVELMTRISPEFCLIRLNGDVIPSFEPAELEPGIHTVEITDAIGCVTKRYIMVYEFEQQPAVEETKTFSPGMATLHNKLLAR